MKKKERRGGGDDDKVASQWHHLKGERSGVSPLIRSRRAERWGDGWIRGVGGAGSAGNRKREKERWLDFMCKRERCAGLAQTLKVTPRHLMEQYIFFNEVMVQSHLTTAPTTTPVCWVKMSPCVCVCVCVCVSDVHGRCALRQTVWHVKHSTSTIHLQPPGVCIGVCVCVCTCVIYGRAVRWVEDQHSHHSGPRPNGESW